MTLVVHVLKGCGVLILIAYTHVTMSFGVQGECFPCFVCGMTLLCQGWGVKHVPIPCKIKGLVFGSAGMNPTPLKHMIS